jgi:uncharacterized protein (DUF1684 family)
MTDADASDGYEAQLRANRTEKDQFFADHPQSPIPPADRDDFDGLAYFDPDPWYRIEATASLDSPFASCTRQTPVRRCLRL